MGNQELINPLLHYRYDYCFKCNSQSIECYDYFNNPIGYSKMVSYKLNNMDWKGKILKGKVILKMECKSCGQKYDIIFEEKDKFPIPIIKDFLLSKIFYSGFKDDGKEFFREKQLNLPEI